MPRPYRAILRVKESFCVSPVLIEKQFLKLTRAYSYPKLTFTKKQKRPRFALNQGRFYFCFKAI